MAENKKRVKGFSNNGVEWPGQSEFDQDYISIEILDKVVKTGDGENDYVIVKHVVTTKTPIKEVVEADRDSVGVENIIRQVMRTGDTSLLPVDKGNPFVDVVGAPENLMELENFGKKAEAAFSKLDPSITEGLDMKAFVESMSQEKFDSLMKAIADRSSGKVETKDE